MRLSHIPIPRNLHSASQRIPSPFLLSIATPCHSFKQTTLAGCTPYSRLYNSSLASTPTTSADVDSNVITQRLPSDCNQSTPVHEYNKLVEAGKLRSDDYQTHIIQKLQSLHDALALYDPPPSAGPPSLVSISPLFPFALHSTYISHTSSFRAFSPVRHLALWILTDRGVCISTVMSGQERLCSWTSSTTHFPYASPTNDACISTHSCLMSTNECMPPRRPAQATRFYLSHETLQMRRTYYAWTSSR